MEQIAIEVKGILHLYLNSLDKARKIAELPIQTVICS